ncbi:hypothetical protein CWB96_19090 [Pseudoalteromonas citrea]|uniref:Cell wall-binding protein n=1 Tax=Pseudoalteromonas citrea TaxID=43655 RepID=A0A5S3XMC6_9GAMM|nr:InlB B-repeat-containing protein [Pseudoalteromonas citrea]TMP42294.1 hypothetical protein CWB97_12280 [Pseudoalteromonas citrea]TMP54589.1 hypothetical protein CWB96_19090 [Pseudoalteromonas citrea]
MFMNTCNKLLVAASLVFACQASADEAQLSPLCEPTLETAQRAFDVIYNNKKNAFSEAVSSSTYQCQQAKLGQSSFSLDKQVNTLDDAPPELRGFSLSAHNVNLDNGSVTLTFTVQAYDLSGLDSVTVGIVAPNISYPFPIPRNRVKFGNWLETTEENVYEASGSITLSPSHIDAGKWSAVMLFLRDTTGRYVPRYKPETLEAKGFNPYLVVENNTVLDKKAPELRSLIFSSNSFDVSIEKQTLTGVVELYDINKVKSATLRLSPPEGLSSSLTKLAEFENIRLSKEENVYKADVKLVLDNKDAPGVWLAGLHVSDDKLNSTGAISSNVVRNAGYNPDIEIINTVDVDLLPPELRAVEVSENDITVISGVKHITVSVLAYDPSGIDRGYLSLRSPIGESVWVKGVQLEDWQPTTQDDVYSAQATFPFNAEDPAGDWHIQVHGIVDKNYNEFDLFDIDHFIERGINPYILVNVEEQEKRDYTLSTRLDNIDLETNNSATVELFIQESNGHTLPRTMTVLAKGTANVSALYEAIGGTGSVNCTGKNALLTCDLAIPADQTEFSISYTLESTDKTTADNVQFTLITGDAEADLTNNKANITVNVLEPIYYQVEFLDWDGRIVAQQEVKAGESAKPVEVLLERLGHTFIGWDKPLVNIMSDTSITAQYEVNHYMVKFVNWDGAVLSQSMVAHGSSAVPPSSVPVPEGKVFTGWDVNYEHIASSVEITAMVETKTYTVEFKDWNGATISSVLVEHGKAAEAPDRPQREGYTFLRWDKAFDSITQAESITAQYSQNIEIEIPEIDTSSDSGSFGLFSLLFGVMLVFRRKV